MNNKKRLSKLAVILLCAAALSACSSNSNTATGTTGSANTNTSETAAAVQTASLELDDTVEYDEDDAYTDWSAEEVTKITLNGASATVDGSGAEVKDGIVTISAAGTYVASGTLDEGQIVVKVADKGTVRLVLNGAEIHYSKSSPIYVEEAGKLILSLPEGTSNVVSDGTDYVFPDAETDEPNAAIFSKDDMTINGTGKLTVEGNYNNGIASKDKLKITGGTFEIQAADDAIMGRDLVAVKDGSFTLDAAGHGMKTTNDTAGEEGIIVLEGGTYNIETGEDALHSTGGLSISGGDYAIAAGDDGIHAETAMLIAGGTIDITRSNEGIEATDITIAGGDIKVVSSDDGVNAATGADGSGVDGAAPGGGGAPASGASEGLLTISGGTLTVDATGDGLDANGSITMSGGAVFVNGPTENGNGSLDYDGTFDLAGGTIVAAGSSGMVQAASDSSTQAGILMMFPQAQQAGTLVHLEDESGKEILTFAPSKSFQAVFISTPEMAKGASYTLYSGGKSTGTATNGVYANGNYSGGTKVVSFTAESLITWVNESGVTEAQAGFGGSGRGSGGGGRGMGGGGRGMGGAMPQDGAAPPDGAAAPATTQAQ